MACVTGFAGTLPGQFEPAPEKAPGGGHGRRPGAQEFGGQARGHGGRFGGEMGMRQGPPQEAMIAHILGNQELAKELGLSAEQVSALREGFDALRQGQIELKAQIELAAMEQAKQMTAPEVNEAELMATVEKTGEIRTQMAKLRVKALLLVREHITSEQLEHIRKTMREKFEQRMRQHRGAFGQGRGGPGNRQQRRRDGGEEWHPPRPPRDDGVKETEREF